MNTTFSSKRYTFHFMTGLLMIPFLLGAEVISIPVDQSTVEVDLSFLNSPIQLHVVSSESNVTVKSHDSDKIEIHLTGAGTIDSAELKIDTASNVIRLHRRGDLMEMPIECIVPVNSMLSAHTEDGNISVYGIKGDIVCSSEDGNINLTDVSGGISASAEDGNVTVFLSESDSNKPISISTEDGNIKCVIPDRINATIRASAMDGVVMNQISKSKRKPNLKKNKGKDTWDQVFPENILQTIIGDGSRFVQLQTLDGCIYLMN